MTCIVGVETKTGAYIGADSFIGGSSYVESAYKAIIEAYSEAKAEIDASYTVYV